MKFTEIKAVLIEKMAIQVNTGNEINYRIAKLQEDFDIIKADIVLMQEMIESIDNLSNLAE